MFLLTNILRKMVIFDLRMKNGIRIASVSLHAKEEETKFPIRINLKYNLQIFVFFHRLYEQGPQNMTLLYTRSQNLSIPSFLSTIHGVYLNKCVSRLHPWLSLSESLPGGQFVMQHSPSLIQSGLWIYLRPLNLTHLTLLTNEGREVGRTVRSPSSSVFPNPISLC